jgi:hypothetical protein
MSVSSSLEIACLACIDSKWVVLDFPEEFPAELPLLAGSDETSKAVGMGTDFTGGNEPVLFVMMEDGRVAAYHCVNSLMGEGEVAGSTVAVQTVSFAGLDAKAAVAPSFEASSSKKAPGLWIFIRRRKVCGHRHNPSTFFVWRG